MAEEITQEARNAGAMFQELVEIMARLRAPGGCPWDRKQTFDTIKPYLLEEAYEVMDAIDRRDWDGLQEELGDLLLQPVFFAEMAREDGLFEIADCLRAINEKLVRRHPHVFAGATAETPEAVLQRWDEIKKQEKTSRGESTPMPLLNSVPRNIPALVEAQKISDKAAAVGFEWPAIDGVVEKLQEEVAELAQARAAENPAEIEHEVGDLLFTLVNLARFLKIDPEQALRKSNTRFRSRFGFIEEQVERSGSKLSEMPLDRLEELWSEAKLREKSSATG